MENEIIKVWISKYALSSGLEEIEGKISPNFPERLQDNRKGYYNSFGKNEWHKSKEEAIADAEQRRQKKIKSLEKQIEKLKKLQF